MSMRGFDLARHLARLFRQLERSWRRCSATYRRAAALRRRSTSGSRPERRAHDGAAGERAGLRAGARQRRRVRNNDEVIRGNMRVVRRPVAPPGGGALQRSWTDRVVQSEEYGPRPPHRERIASPGDRAGRGRFAAAPCPRRDVVKDRVEGRDRRSRGHGPDAWTEKPPGIILRAARTSPRSSSSTMRGPATVANSRVRARSRDQGRRGAHALALPAMLLSAAD